VPPVASWLAVEIGAGFAQFTAFGLLLGAIHAEPRRHSQCGPEQPAEPVASLTD
jgi:hypothetical protein